MTFLRRTLVAGGCVTNPRRSPSEFCLLPTYARSQRDRTYGHNIREGVKWRLIVTGSAPATVHRKLIIGLAARHNLPAVYVNRFLVDDGGLLSYGPHFVDQVRRAASYVDRILNVEKPADLPVQAPTKYKLVIR